jgi:hypothetical protein
MAANICLMLPIYSHYNFLVELGLVIPTMLNSPGKKGQGLYANL